MATRISKIKIKHDSPFGGDPVTHVKLVVYYSIAENYYLFLYRIFEITDADGNKIAPDPQFAEGAKSFGRVEFADDPSGERRVVNKYFEDLDIGIRRGFKRVQVTVETADNDPFTDLYWYQSPGANPSIEAVMTLEDRKTYYGDLEYSDSGNDDDWTKTIPSERCRFIRFKAKEKRGDPDEHKFSYYVRVPGLPIPFEVDPDIQNPKV